MTTVILFAACCAFFGMIPLLGLPGALALAVGDTMLNWTVGFVGYDSIFTLERQDTWAWPAAIIATWIWPVGLIISHLLAFRILSLQKLHAYLTYVALLLTWIVITTIIVYFMVLSTVETLSGNIV